MHIDEFLEKKGQNVDSYLFWRAAIIVCDAIINHAHRTHHWHARRQLQIQMKRQAELLQIADMCEYVPENRRVTSEKRCSLGPRRSRQGNEHPMHNQPQWGRGDTYLYPFFINDIHNGTTTVQEALNLLAEVVGRWGTQLMVQSSLHKQTHQITYGITP